MIPTAIYTDLPWIVLVLAVLVAVLLVAYLRLSRRLNGDLDELGATIADAVATFSKLQAHHTNLRASVQQIQNVLAEQRRNAPGRPGPAPEPGTRPQPIARASRGATASRVAAVADPAGYTSPYGMPRVAHGATASRAEPSTVPIRSAGRHSRLGN